MLGLATGKLKIECTKEAASYIWYGSVAENFLHDLLLFNTQKFGENKQKFYSYTL